MGVDRRAFLAFAAGSYSIAQGADLRGDVQPSEAKRYLDAATEFPVVRLTNPAHQSYLTASYNRGIGNRNFMLFSSDRDGKFDAYRLELRGGQFRRMTNAEGLLPGSIALLPDDRSFCYISEGSLRVVNMLNARDRDVYRVTPPFEQLAAVSISGGHAVVVERRPGRDRIRTVPLTRGVVADLVESDAEISMPLPHPGGGVAYRSGGSVWFCAPSERERVLPLARGQTGPAYWSHDGASILYLNVPEDRKERNSVREHVLASGQDRLIARTTQFVQFAPNADDSVFVGASGSKASPHILILVRSVGRELTVCEHRARDPRNLAVAFTPNSQRVVFQSDHEGKPALYIVNVERFVEETES